MMTLRIGEKDYNIKFGYEATLKSRILSKIAKTSAGAEGGTNLEDVEDLLLMIPEIVLVGLQKYHKDEFEYNYDTEAGKDEQLNKVFEMVDEYFDGENADVMELYNELQQELLRNGFLSKMFEQEMEKAENSQKGKKK